MLPKNFLDFFRQLPAISFCAYTTLFVGQFSDESTSYLLFIYMIFCLSFVTIFSPILIVFGRCLELHELGDVVEEGEDHYDTDVAPALAHAALKYHL